MRSKWYKSNAPALQMALMKLICTDEERMKLSINHIDHTSKGKEIKVGVASLDDDEEYIDD